MNVELTISIKRRINRKKYFNQNNFEDEKNQLLGELFRVEYFLVVVDMTKTSFKSRFEQLKQFESIFGFLLH